MPRNTNNRRSSRRNQSNVKKIASNEVQQTQLLKNLVYMQNQSFDLPTVPDVTPMKIAKRKIYTFSRQSAPTNISAAATEQVYAYYFSLSQLDGYTDFVSLFDQYRILQVKVVIRAVPGVTLNPNAYISAIDYDDATALPYNQLSQYQTAMISSSGVSQTRYLNPKQAIGTYNGVATLGYASARNLWNDMANSSVQYYGLKVAVPASASGSTAVFATITAEYVFQCINPR